MKIGAIGIRTKIIVGDAATWYLVKKYIDGKVGAGIEDVPEELKKYVRVLDSWVDVTEDLASIENKVDKVAGKSLIADTEIDKLAAYPEYENLEFSHENLTDKNSDAAFQHVDSTEELGESINEANHSLILWNGTKPLKVLFSRVATFFETYFLKFGGQVFGAKKTIGSTDNQALAFMVNGIERAVFLAGGDFSIVNPRIRIGGVKVMDFENDDTRLNCRTLGKSVIIANYNTGNANVTFKDSGETGMGTTSPKSKLQVAGAVQIADDTAAANADKEGAIRYRKDANNSYIEMCMKTGVSTYAWEIIKQNTW